MKVDFEKHSQALARFALSLTGRHEFAEDLVQETLLRAIRHRGNGETVIQNPKSWLFTIAVNCWRDQCRRQKRMPATEPLHLVDEAVAATGNTNQTPREHLETVLTTFQELPQRQREVLYLRTVEGFSISEVAEMLGITEGNTKTTLSIARKKLRERCARVGAGEAGR